MSTPEKSAESKRTTQQTGNFYTYYFSIGFLAQKKEVLEGGS